MFFYIIMSDIYNLICGAVSGAVSRTFTAPLELKKLPSSAVINIFLELLLYWPNFVSGYWRRLP